MNVTIEKTNPNVSSLFPVIYPNKFSYVISKLDISLTKLQIERGAIIINAIIANISEKKEYRI